MKGDMMDIFATLIFIGGIVATVLFLRAYFISYTGGVETPIENMEALQAAYAVESCLVSWSGDDGYIMSDILDQKNGKFVGDKDFCNIPYPPIHAEVKDIETGKEWKFTRPTWDKLESAFDWLRDKMQFWEKERQTSQPKHSIFIPIMYDKITNFEDDDVIIESGRKYVLVYSKTNGGSLKLDIYPIERYGKDVSTLEFIKIEKMDDLSNLKNDMKNTPTGTEKAKITINYLYKNMTAGDIRGSFKLAASPSDCEGSSDDKICITHHAREIHGGKLYVEI